MSFEDDPLEEMYDPRSQIANVVEWPEGMDPTLAPLDHEYTDTIHYRETRVYSLDGVKHLVRFVPSMAHGLNRVQLLISDTKVAKLSDGSYLKHFRTSPGISILKSGIVRKTLSNNISVIADGYSVKIGTQTLEGIWSLDDLFLVPGVFVRISSERDLSPPPMRLIDKSISLSDLVEEPEVSSEISDPAESRYFLPQDLYAAYLEGRQSFASWQESNKVTFHDLYKNNLEIPEYEIFKFKAGIPSYQDIALLILSIHSSYIEEIEKIESSPHVNVGMLSNTLGDNISPSTLMYINERLDVSSTPRDTLTSFGEVEKWTQSGISEHILRGYIFRFLRALNKPCLPFRKKYTATDKAILRILDKSNPFVDGKPNYKYPLKPLPVIRNGESLESFKERQEYHNTIRPDFPNEAFFHVWLCTEASAFPVLSGEVSKEFDLSTREFFDVAAWCRRLKADGSEGSVIRVPAITMMNPFSVSAFSAETRTGVLFPELSKFFAKWLKIYMSGLHKDYTLEIEEDLNKVMEEFRDFQNSQFDKLVALNAEVLLSDFAHQIVESSLIVDADPGLARQEWSKLTSYVYSREFGLSLKLKPSSKLLLPHNIWDGEMIPLWRALGYNLSNVPRTERHLKKMISESLLRVPFSERTKKYQNGRLVKWDTKFNEWGTGGSSGLVGELLSRWWRKYIGFKLPTYPHNLLRASLNDLKAAYPEEIWGSMVAPALYRAAKNWGFKSSERPSLTESNQKTLNRIELFINKAFPFNTMPFSISVLEAQRAGLTEQDVNELRSAHSDRLRESNKRIGLLRQILSSWNPESMMYLLNQVPVSIANIALQDKDILCEENNEH